MKHDRARRLLDQSNPQDALVQDLRAQIDSLKKENSKLQKSIDSWKDAWYEQRDITGWIHWWFHKWKQASHARFVEQFPGHLSDLVGQGTRCSVIREEQMKHIWAHDGAERRGDRILYFNYCKTCGVSKTVCYENGFKLEDIVNEDCEFVQVEQVMES